MPIDQAGTVYCSDGCQDALVAEADMTYTHNPGRARLIHK